MIAREKIRDYFGKEKKEQTTAENSQVQPDPSKKNDDEAKPYNDDSESFSKFQTNFEKGFFFFFL